MKKFKFLLLTLLALTMFSCGSSKNISKLTSENYAPTEPQSIEIFTSTQPTKDFIEIATISVLRVKSKIFPVNRPTQKIMVDMKEKAASVGGHAIINYRESGEANMTGTVIRYK